jgi:UPF0271 protein
MKSNQHTIDLNCDMGEGMNTDAAIMPFISSVNIACGYHAGDEMTIWDTIELAVQHNIAIGAHVSFLDKANFGRQEMDIPIEEVYEIIIQQLIIMDEIAGSFAARLNHVKPHGALYNMSAKNPLIARTIANAVKDFDHTLILCGLSGSHSITEGRAAGLETASEVFADRSYQDDGSLTPRDLPGALLENKEQVVKQVLQMIKEKKVTTVSGKQVPIEAETICIHGDGAYAIEFVKAIHDKLKEESIDIKGFLNTDGTDNTDLHG